MAFRTSAERYDRLVELTCKLTGLQAIPQGYDPWEGMVRTWKLYYWYFQCEDILFATIHSLKWGVYPASEDEPMCWALNRGTPLEQDTAELMALFREELISPEAEGAAELHDWEGFKGVYHVIGYHNICHNDHGPETRTHIHHQYLENRLDHLVHSFDPDDNRWNEFREFEDAIHFLLPSSFAWPEASWLDEGFILQELDRAFGTNFHANPDNLDRLVHLVQSVQSGDTAPRYTLASLYELTFDLAKHIWPVDTIKHVIKAYRAVLKVARENENRASKRKSKQLEPYEFGYANVKNTGIHQLTAVLVGNGFISEHAIKEQVYNMQFCY